MRRVGRQNCLPKPVAAEHPIKSKYFIIIIVLVII